MVVKRVKKEPAASGSDAPAPGSGGEQGSDRSESGGKQTRSAFGCDACKKRKIKCDEGRVSVDAGAELTPADMYELLCEFAQARTAVRLCIRLHCAPKVRRRLFLD